MRRRWSRARRFLKWTGLAVCLVLLAAWVLSIRWTLNYASGQRACSISIGCLELTNVSVSDARHGWLVFRHPKQGLVYWPRTVSAGWGRSIMIPLWLLIVPILIPTAVLWWRDRRPPPGHCQTCGYDLIGNVTGVCPECGEPI